MKTLVEALAWALVATSALAVIGTSASAAKDLTTLKALRAPPQEPAAEPEEH